MKIPNRSWWLILGVLTFLLAGLGSGIGAFDSKYLGDSLLGIIDWFTASILYFFLGAIVGLGIDFWISKSNKTKFKLPLWFYVTLSFIIISLITIFISLPPKSLSDFTFDIIFPFYYAIFFPGFAYFVFFSAILKQSFLAKIVLDIIYLGIFGFWLNNQLTYLERKSTTNKILLYIIFIILTIGMISCAIRLGMS